MGLKYFIRELVGIDLGVTEEEERKAIREHEEERKRNEDPHYIFGHQDLYPSWALDDRD